MCGYYAVLRKKCGYYARVQKCSYFASAPDTTTSVSLCVLAEMPIADPFNRTRCSSPLLRRLGAAFSHRRQPVFRVLNSSYSVVLIFQVDKFHELLQGNEDICAVKC
jgi:hypothetical protein